MLDSIRRYLIICKFLQKFEVFKLLDLRVEIVIPGQNTNSVVKMPQVLWNYDGKKFAGRVGLFKREKSTSVLVKIIKIDSKKCVIQSCSGDSSSQAVPFNEVKMASRCRWN